MKRSFLALLCAAAVLTATAGRAQDVVSQQASSNSVVEWSLIAEDSIVGVAGRAPAASSINMAMVHIAIYDAVNSIEASDYPNFAIHPVPRPGASLHAAVAGAAHGVLVGMFPAQQATLDAKLALTLATIPDGSPKEDGLTLGTEVAAGVLAFEPTTAEAPPIRIRNRSRLASGNARPRRLQPQSALSCRTSRRSR
jgi:hypothetical protein